MKRWLGTWRSSLVLATTCLMFPLMGWAFGPDPGYSAIDQRVELNTEYINETSAQGETEVTDVLEIQTVLPGLFGPLRSIEIAKLNATNEAYEDPEVGWYSHKAIIR